MILRKETTDDHNSSFQDGIFCFLFFNYILFFKWKSSKILYFYSFRIFYIFTSAFAVSVYLYEKDENKCLLSCLINMQCYIVMRTF